MSDKKYIIANWKCTKNIDACIEWLDVVGPQLAEFEDYEIIVCPPFVALDAVTKHIMHAHYPIQVGAQTVSLYELGAYTGEVAAFMLEGIAAYALVGHSERRSLKNETNEDIAKQVEQCVRCKIKPIVLVRDEHDVIPKEVKVFAWEPVSAIGTGNAIDAATAGERIGILPSIGDMQGLYGGSVNSSNIASFMNHPTIAGVLIGSASNDPSSFMEMLHALR